MVDFQERDTRRDLGDGGEEEDDAEAGTEDGTGEAEKNVRVSDAAERAAAERDAAEGDRELQPGDETDHDHHAHDLESVSLAVLTISSSRTIKEDDAGDAIVAAIDGAGHEVSTRNLINDDYDGVQSEVDTLVGRDDVDAVVTTGGTGVAPTDVTVEAVRPLFAKELPGFGELFRALSREEIGTRVVGTRAIAGIADGVPVFCLPGSEAAARLGAEEIVCPEVSHLAGLACREEAEEPEETVGGPN